MICSVTPRPFCYNFIQELYVGESTKVFKAFRRDPSTNWQQICVVKVINSKNSVEDCVLEYESLSKVYSNNCVRVFCWEWIDGCPALVMEHIEGVSLLELLEFGEISQRAAEEIVRQVGVGLRDLWSHGLLHGDLNLRNVLVTKEGRVKLIDYGLANFRGKRGKFSPDFVAPEVIDRQEYSEKSDLYALGALAGKLGLSNKKYKILQSNNLEGRRLPTNHKSKKGVLDLMAAYKRAELNLEKRQKTVVFESLGEVKFWKGQYLKLNQIIVALMLVMILFSKGDHQNKYSTDWAMLSVKGAGWARVFVEDKFFGYSPFEMIPVPAKTLRVRWENESFSEGGTLTPRPGEHKILHIDP